MKSAHPFTSVNLASGLGNQLFQLAAGLHVSQSSPLTLLANLSPTRQHIPGQPDIAAFSMPANVTIENSQRPFLISWFGRKTTNLILRISTNRNWPNQHSIFSKIVIALADSILSAALSRKASVIGAANVSYDTRISTKLQGSMLIGYFQTWRYLDDPFVSVAMRNMKLNYHSTWLEELALQSEIETPIVVHVRIGDYKDNDDFSIVTPDYIEQALKLLRSNGNNGKLWLFSDEPDEAIKLLSAHEKSLNPRVIEAPPGHGHPAAVLSAMRLGHAFVLSNSTFGWWAAWLSGCNGGNVVYPSNWFGNSIPDGDVCPPKWHAVTGNETSA
jgi:hypothetical protein